MRGIRARLPLLLVCATLSFALAEAPVYAQDEAAKKEAQQHFATGVEFFNSGEYGAALAEFFWAYEVSPHFMVLYNIARCYARINKHIEAQQYFEQYLAEGGDGIAKKRLEEVQAEMAALKKIIAYLDIKTGDVKGATIKVGEKVIGQTPLEKAVAVEPGPVNVSAEADGYQSESKEIVVPAGKTIEVAFALVWVVKWGQLEVVSEAPNSTVYIDGKEMGKAPWKGKLKSGVHTVEVRAPGYIKDVKEVMVEQDDERTLTLKPSIQGEPARLVIEANVEGAEVFIEGVKMGTIPIKPLDLPPGPAHVTVKASGYIAFEGDIQLTAGSPVTAKVKLVREGAGVAPGWFWSMAAVAIGSVIGGTITGILALQKQNDYDAFLKEVAAGTHACLPSFTQCESVRKGIHDSGQTLQLTTDILWGSTAAFGITAIVLAFFTRFKPPESKVEVALQPAVWPGYLGLNLGGTF